MNSLAHIATIGCHLLVIKSEQVLVVLLGLTQPFKCALETQVQVPRSVHCVNTQCQFLPISYERIEGFPNSYAF